MLEAMARSRFNVKTLIPWLAAVVLLLGGLILWLAATGGRPVSREPAHRMAERQIREQRGNDWEVRYIEAGSGPVLCGYAALRYRPGPPDQPVAFISRVGRVLFADDPLPAEFRDLRQRYCPGFIQAPPPA